MSISQNFPTITPTLNLNFARSKKLDPRITFTRTSSATRTNGQGLIEVVSADTPRFEHSVVGVGSTVTSVQSLGLLIEESRTNLLLRSQDLLTSPNLSAAGLGSFFTATADALPSPSGSTNETVKFVSTSTTSEGLFLRQTGLSLTATTYTVSMYVYVPTQVGISNWSMVFDYNDSPVDFGTTSVSTVFDRWVRVSLTTTLTSTRSILDFNIRINGNTAPTTAGFTLYAWGIQLEAGAFPTSYIPTVASTVTRSGDLAFIDLPSTGWYNYSQGSLVFQHSTVPYATGTSPGYPAVGFAQTNGSSTNAIQYFFAKDTGGTQVLIRDANVDQAGLGPTTPTGMSAGKVGFAYTTNFFVLARNGSQLGTDTSGTVPQSIGTLLLGTNSKSVANNLNACISNVIYYPRALSSSQLQNLTK